MGKRPLHCQNCPECEYIGDGDYACMKDVPIVVLTEFNEPTDNYMWCRKEETMQIIKVRFLKEGKPTGRAYTYYSPVEMAVGDMVQINSAATGIVTEVDVQEEEVAAYRDKLKTIVGRIEEEK